MRPDDSNPFSTSRVRPGALAFRFGDGRDARDVVRQFERCGGRGQITGPHGSGKSTLVQTLIPELRRAGWSVELWRIRPGATIEVTSVGESSARRVRIVDGYEQLNGWRRGQLKLWRWWHRAGLLVTSHADAGLPSLAETTATVELAQSIVSTLLADFPPLVDSRDVVEAYSRYPENLREVLFALYDLYETRRTSRHSRKPT